MSAAAEMNTAAAGRPLPVSLLRHRPRLDAGASALDNIAKVIGVGAALRLCARFGGSRVYIPTNPAPGNPIASAIGYSKAARLSTFFGGERLSIPSEGAQANRLRIVRMRRRGVTVSEIARGLKCGERYVYKVLAQFRDERGMEMKCAGDEPCR